MFALGKPLQDCIVFGSKAGAYLSEAPFICSTLGQALAFQTNTRLGRKGLSGANNLAYYEKLQLTAVKSFYNISPWAQYCKTFYVLTLRNFVLILSTR